MSPSGRPAARRTRTKPARNLNARFNLSVRTQRDADVVDERLRGVTTRPFAEDFAGMETAARRNCAVSPNSSSLGNSADKR